MRADVEQAEAVPEGAVRQGEALAEHLVAAVDAEDGRAGLDGVAELG